MTHHTTRPTTATTTSPPISNVTTSFRSVCSADVVETANTNVLPPRIFTTTTRTRFESSAAVTTVTGCGIAASLASLGASVSSTCEPGKVLTESRIHIARMIAVTLACLPVLMTGREIARWEGLVFVLYYAAYVTYLILAARQHETLGVFSTAMMMSFVIPITVITLVVLLVQRGAPPDRTNQRSG